MTLVEILGYGAAILLVASFAMKPIRWLRYFAIASGAVLAVYAVAAAHYPVLVIALVIVALNVWRLVETERMAGAVRAAIAGAGAPMSVEWLMPYMRPVTLTKGEVLFRKGDIADSVYFISSGRVRIDEYGVEIGKGSLFGEVGVFATDATRTAGATCSEPCSLMVISAEKMRELYFQNPEFGFFLVGVITKRLMEDVERAANRAKG